MKDGTWIKLVSQSSACVRMLIRPKGQELLRIPECGGRLGRYNKNKKRMLKGYGVMIWVHLMWHSEHKPE
jgi:hypothetical protein